MVIGFLSRRKHSRLRGLLSSYIDGQVSESEARQVEDHLHACEECRQEMDNLRATVSLIRSLPQLETLRSFTLTEEPAPAKTARTMVWTTRLATSAAAVLLVALLLGDTLGIFAQTGVLDAPASMAVSSEAFAPPAAPVPAAAPVAPVSTVAVERAQPEVPEAVATAPVAPAAAAPAPAPAAAIAAPAEEAEESPVEEMAVEVTPESEAARAEEDVMSVEGLEPAPVAAMAASSPETEAATAEEVQVEEAEAAIPEDMTLVAQALEALDEATVQEIEGGSDVAIAQSPPAVAAPSPGGVTAPQTARTLTPESGLVQREIAALEAISPGVGGGEVRRAETTTGIAMPLWQLEATVSILLLVLGMAMLRVARRDRSRIP